MLARSLIPLLHLAAGLRRVTTTANLDKPMRLERAITARGAAESRRLAAELLRNKRVSVNGVPRRSSKLKIEPTDLITVNGVDYPNPPLLVRYHKPVGVHSVMRDPLERECLADVLPDQFRNFCRSHLP